MSTWLLLNSLGLAAVCGVLYLVVRQLGYVLHRVTPPGARSSSDGPRIGENLAHYLPEMSHDIVREKARLVIFLSNECSICTVIRAGAEELARTWKSDAHIFLIYDGREPGDETSVSEVQPGLWERRSFSLRRTLGATFVPFAVVTDRHGTVAGKGLVNEIGHLESLLEVEKAQANPPHCAAGTSSNLDVVTSEVQHGSSNA